MPLNKIVVGPEHTRVPLNEPLPDGGCATLTVTWGIETPLLIGQSAERRETTQVSDRGNRQERRAEGGEADVVVPLGLGDPKRWMIPGGTLRGLVRSSLEIIAFARLRQVNEHFRFGVRDFTHARYRDESPVGKDEQVRAGWLRKGGDRYDITPCAHAGEDWGYVEIESLPGGDDRVAWSRKDRAGKLKEVGDRATNFVAGSGRPLPDGKIGRTIYLPDASGRAGELVVSGRAVGTKRYEYVFFADPDATSTTIDADAWKQFELMNCRQGRTRLEPDGAWKQLAPQLDQPDGKIPVFWVGDIARQDADFAFGLTRLFKIPHRHSVGGKIPSELKPKLNAAGEPEVDFVENLFGYVYERDELANIAEGGEPPNAAAHRSRIAFGFAAPINAEAFTLWPAPGPQDTIMMAPRASYAPYYLIGKEKDWSSPDSQLAGRKRYPPRYPTGKLGSADAELRERLKDPIERYKAGDRLGREAPGSVRTKLRFLKPISPEAAFKSTIKLHNVTKIELGAVLWALTFGGDPHGLYRQMLGRAKGMGAGQTAVRKIHITWRPHRAAEETAVWPEVADGLAKRVLTDFETYMEKATGRPLRSSDMIKDYLKLHAPGTWADLAGKLTAAMGSAAADERHRVIERARAEKGLANSFLERPDLANPHKTSNDFQRIRDATKLGDNGLDPPDSTIPEQLLRIP